MFRYFACVWNPDRATQREAAAFVRQRLAQTSSPWQTQLCIDGLFVACTDATRSLCALTLPDTSGVVFGSLFERNRDLLDDSLMRHARPDASSTVRMLDSNGRELIENYWGNYVAFLYRPGHLTVIVSPTGTLPCLSSTVESVTWFYACIDDALALGLPVPRRCHIYTRDRVLGRFVDSRNPLNEVTRLLRSEALSYRLKSHPLGVKRHVLWRPQRFAETTEPLDDPSQAARAVRSAVRACTQTLAADHQHVQLRLSGGLDSSIIAGCLRDAPCEVSCHTYFGANSTTDVRPWARRAASYCGFPLSEHPLDAAAFAMPALAGLRRSADVASLMEYLFRAGLERELCRDHDATAIFTGDGGDSGFCSDSVSRCVVEYLRRHGLTWRIWDLARHVALATHRSTWQVIALSLRRWKRRGRIEKQPVLDPAMTMLVEPELVRAAGDRIDHPWFKDEKEVSWVTLYRLGALVLPPQNDDLSIAPCEFAPDVARPLYAQPVVELLLRIPLYVHFENGRDRGLARRAFQEDAPAANLQRLWKDRAPGYFNELLAAHGAWLREILLDGVLVDARMLNRKAVEAALSDEPSRSLVNPAEIFRHLNTELWARHWMHA